jgi:hypothetical protein
LPILDFCSSVWSPHKLTDIDRLEDVQRYFTKRLSGLWYKSYKQRLVDCMYCYNLFILYLMLINV